MDTNEPKCGQGVSVAIIDLIEMARAAGKRVVYDINGEYISQYYRPDKDRMLDPTKPYDWEPACAGNAGDDATTNGPSPEQVDPDES